jgi:uncharacterized protein (DUF1778 family)
MAATEAIHIRILPESKDLIKKAAEKEGRTVSNWIIFTCERAARASIAKKQ